MFLTIDEPKLVRAAVEEVGDGTEHLRVAIDDRGRAARLHDSLIGVGCHEVRSTVHLALVPPLRVVPGPHDLLVEELAGVSELPAWARVKLQSFDDSESEPSPDRIADEVQKLVAELPLTRLCIGAIGAERVAVLAHYTGNDQLVFNLGTRLSYRHRGIAQAMLAHWVAEGEAAGCRSLIINGTEGGRPAELYKSIGFVDEVYWYKLYELG